MRFFIALCVAMLTLAGPTEAQTTKTVVLEFGLIGTWADDCARPATEANVHTSFAIKDAEIMRIRDVGANFPKQTWIVTSAKRLAADMVELQMHIGPETASMTLRKVGDKLEIVTPIRRDARMGADERRLQATRGLPLMSRCR